MNKALWITVVGTSLVCNLIAFSLGSHYGSRGPLLEECKVMMEINPLISQFGPSCEVQDGRVVLVVTNPRNPAEQNILDVLTGKIKHLGKQE